MITKEDNKRIQELKRTVHSRWLEEAIYLINNDQNIKLILQDLYEHFQRSDAWSLDYQCYLEMSKVYYVTFNIILDMSGYKIVYNRKLHQLVVKRK
jgi:hypothetical protein